MKQFIIIGNNQVRRSGVQIGDRVGRGERDAAHTGGARGGNAGERVFKMVYSFPDKRHS